MRHESGFEPGAVRERRYNDDKPRGLELSRAMTDPCVK